MNTIGLNMFPVTSTATVKPEIDNSDIQLSIPLAMQQEKFPKWITDFNMKCLEICGTTCSEKLDEMMELYIKEVKREMVYYGPGNASVVVNRMSRTMLFFYLKYVDIKEFIVISQWNEHMEDLLSMYCQLELRSAQRGKDSDIIICSRIMYALWTYLNSKEEHMLHVLLKIPNISKRHKKILDPLFRKLLVNKKKPDCDLEYIRKLFAYKLWQRLYNVDEKKAISELAYNELQPPKSFIANYTKYHFLPRNLGSSDFHRALITAMFDIENAIHAYFEYVDNKKKSFMTEFRNSFSTNDNFDEISTTSEPQWCSNLIKISEECVPATPPYSITEEDTQQTIQCLEKEGMGKREIIEQIPAHTITQIENELINEEIESKINEPPPLDVKISSVSMQMPIPVPVPGPGLGLGSMPVQVNTATVSSNMDFEQYTYEQQASRSTRVESFTATCSNGSVSNLNYKESISSTANLENNRKRKNGDIPQVVRATTNRPSISKPQTPPPPLPVPVEIPPQPEVAHRPQTSEQKERRVPLSGEKVCRFADTPDIWESVPYWHEIDSSEPPQKFDHSQAPNLLVNVNLDQSEQEIHLPIKKRRVSSFKVEVKDELSCPPTPMISIAELKLLYTTQYFVQ